MTGADAATTNGEMTDVDARLAAWEMFRAAEAAGTTMSGAELGRAFGRTDRWGRKQIERARSGHRSPAAPAGTSGRPDKAGGRNDQPTSTGTPGVVRCADQLPAGDGVRKAIRWITTAAVIVVAACAARASYDHQRHVVEMAGEDQAAWYLPLSVDGMMLVASLNMLVRRWDHQPAGRLTWAALVLGGIASLAANVAAADPTLIGRLVAAWPPACLIVSYELLMQQLPTRGSQGCSPSKP